MVIDTAVLTSLSHHSSGQHGGWAKLAHGSQPCRLQLCLTLVSLPMLLMVREATGVQAAKPHFTLCSMQRSSISLIKQS